MRPNELRLQKLMKHKSKKKGTVRRAEQSIVCKSKLASHKGGAYSNVPLINTSSSAHTTLILERQASLTGPCCSGRSRTRSVCPDG